MPQMLLIASVDRSSDGTPEKNGSPKWRTRRAEETMLKKERRKANSKVVTSVLVSTSLVIPCKMAPIKQPTFIITKTTSGDIGALTTGLPRSGS